MRWIIALVLLASEIALAAPFVIEEATIDSIHRAIQKKEITCEALVRSYIQRIKKYNLDVSHTAPLNAIVYLNPYVFEQARDFDAEFRRSKRLSGRLFCIPILLKDNIDSYDTPSSSGSLALLGLQPPQDAVIVQRLRKQGALILGKTTMDELASGLWGVSSRSGKTGNAYDPRKNSGGSSAGSAVAVSANFAVAALGSDNSGSLRVPAAYNGVYTIRATRGLLSLKGIFPRGALDGIPGPITRTVKDLAIFMDVMSDGLQTQPYISYLQTHTLAHKRIGIVRKINDKEIFSKTPPKIKNIFDRAIQKLTELGASMVDNIELKNYNRDRKDNLAGEVEEINEYLDSIPSPITSYQAFCKSDLFQIFKTSEDCLNFVDKIAGKSSSTYTEVIQKFEKNRGLVEAVMDTDQLDALLLPIDALGPADESGAIEGIQTGIASNAGLPGIVILAGYTEGPSPMPVGMELIGRRLSEGMLIGMSHDFEKRGQDRIPPPIENFAPGDTRAISFSIPKLNHIFTEIGWQAFRQVLKPGKREDLTPEKFREIVKKIMN